MDINEFLGKVRKHLGSESNEFLNLQFSKNAINNFNHNLHYFIVDKIERASFETKFNYMFNPGRFSDNYIAKISGLSKDTINKLRKDPKTTFVPKKLDRIYNDICNFYEYHMAKYYGLTYWNQCTSIRSLRADSKVKE